MNTKSTLLYLFIFLITAVSCKDRSGCSCSSTTKNRNGSFHYFSKGFSRTFCDLNDKHLKVAKSIGIDPKNLEEDLDDCDDLNEIESCRKYKVDVLTHSKPYLVDEAEDLLEKVGTNFMDSLDSKGMPKYNIIVTSLLRTEDDIKRLRKRNRNASRKSAHCYGTTFDVAYTRYYQKARRAVDAGRLKSVLAEVLRDLRNNEECYVRYEVKQGCFHITARPQS